MFGWLKKLFVVPPFCPQCGSKKERASDGFGGYTSPICRNYQCTIGYSLIDQQTWNAVEQTRLHGGKISDYEPY